MAQQQQVNEEIVKQFVLAAHGDMDKVKELAEAHPELLDKKAPWDETALQAAAHCANKEIVSFLIRRGVPLDVFAAIVLDKTETVADMLEEDPSLAQAEGAHGIPILFYPAATGNIEIGKLLLSKGTDVNAGAGGNTALHGAAQFGQSEFAAWLLVEGADINAKNYNEQTPFTIASENGHTETADILRQHGGTE